MQILNIVRYFAHVRIGGKLFRESLETTDRKLADRKLADFQRSKGRTTALAKLRYRKRQTATRRRSVT